MLRSIEINRFKSIVRQRVEFGAVNLFVGGNGSGKSNLLEAIGIASAALARGINDVDLAAKGVRLSAPTLFKSAFKNKDLPSTLRIEADFDGGLEYDLSLRASETMSGLRFATESALDNGTRLFGRSGNGATLNGTRVDFPLNPVRGMYDQVRAVGGFSEKVASEFDRFAKFAIYSPQTEFLRGTEVGLAQQPPVGLHGEGLPQAADSLIEFWSKQSAPEKKRLNDIFKLVWATGWNDQFRVGPMNPLMMSTQVKTGTETLYFRDKFMRTGRNSVTAYDASEGVLFLLFMVVMLAHPESPPMFALDNVDSAINPRMTKFAVSKIVDVVTEDVGNFGRQVFMTSHNPTSMDAIDIFDSRTRIFTVSRNKDGHTILKRLQPPPDSNREQWIAKSGGKTLSELWIADEIPGALGDKIL